MGVSTNGRISLLDEVRSELVRRLRERSADIESAIFGHVRAISGLPEVGAGAVEHAEYVAGLHAAVVGALDYCLTGIEQGEDWAAPIPVTAAEQARRAARSKVSLDTVLRRYAAGERQFVEFVMEHADDLDGHALRHLLRIHGLQIDRFMAAVAAEYMNELDRIARSPEQRLGECVEKLLAGEPVDMSKLDYLLDGSWHVGVVVLGARACKAVRILAEGAGRQLMYVTRGDQTVWAWLGCRRRPLAADIERLLPDGEFSDVTFAIGEPAKGLEGWRLTHRQAQAAVWVALRKPQRITRYADELLVAAALRDEVLAKSLRDIYFEPLCDQRDGGAVLRSTLRAYFAAGRNAATAAALLRVDRHTVQRRLRKIEERLGRLLHTCYPELEVALRMHELGGVDASDGPGTQVENGGANGASHHA